MIAQHDGLPITITDRLIAALKEVMAAQCEMMRNDDLGFADCWQWGVCEIGNLASWDCYIFQYGGFGDETHPDVNPENPFVVVVAPAKEGEGE